MKALAALLIFASVVVAQLPPQAPPVALPPQAPMILSPYDQAQHDAISQNKWLMVFVGCKERKEPNYVTVEVATLEGIQVPSIILARPENGSMHWHSTISQEVRAATPVTFPCSS